MKAESSTIRQVRGAFIGVSDLASSITLLQRIEPTHLVRQVGSHFGERHDLISKSFLHCNPWHTVNSAALFVLRESVTAGIFDLAESFRPVAAHPGHYYSGSR